MIPGLIIRPLEGDIVFVLRVFRQHHVLKKPSPSSTSSHYLAIGTVVRGPTVGGMKILFPTRSRGYGEEMHYLSQAVLVGGVVVRAKTGE